jgi:hypothetical protein
MAERGPPFDFDLNEPPPPEDDDDGADDASRALAPEPVREPSPSDLLPPSPHDTLPPPQHDALPPPAPESSPRDPLPAPSPEPSQRDPAPSQSQSPEPSQLDPLPVPVPESSLHDPHPSPAHEPTPRDPLHPPSPVLDLEAPLSSLDDEDNYDHPVDYDDEELPPPPPLPPSGFPIAAAVPTRSTSSADAPHALPVAPNGHGEPPFSDTARLSSPENSAPRGPSRSASGTASSHRSRRRPYSYDPRDDDAISKQRRVGSYDDDDAGSSRSGSRRSVSPRRYERSGLASPPPHYEQGGGRRVPGTHGPPGAAPPRNRRRQRPRPQHGYQYPGLPIQKQQGFRGQERPLAHQGHHGPSGLDLPNVGFSSYDPLSVRWGSPNGYQSSPERQPNNANGGSHYHQRREAPPFRPSSSQPRGREDSYHGRKSHQAQEHPKNGGYQQRWEEPSLRPSSGPRGRADGSSGEQKKGPPQQPVNGGGGYQQRKAPRNGGEHFPDRPYHPYARDGGAAYDRAKGGHQARREPPPTYEHRRDSQQRPLGGGPSRGRQYYGD